jgi:hypothetical protein
MACTEVWLEDVDVLCPHLIGGRLHYLKNWIARHIYKVMPKVDAFGVATNLT